MQYKTFKVPFSEVVGDDHPEVEFGPEDYLVVRPIFAFPVREISDFRERVGKIEELPDAEAADLLTDILSRTIKEWHLETPDGPIPMPKTADDLDSLPAAIRSMLLPFILTFRGRGPDPTPVA